MHLCALYSQEENGFSLEMGPEEKACRKRSCRWMQENEAQDAGRKVGNWGLQPEGQVTSEEVGSAPREEPRVQRCCLSTTSRSWG